MSQIETFTFNAFGENTYLVFDEKTREAAIVDAGCYEKEETDELIARIDFLKLKVVGLINTHCHIDHILGVEALKQYFKVPFLIPEKEMEVLRSGKIFAPMWGFHNYVEATPDAYFKPGDIYTLGTRTFELLQVPGHSPGHIAFYDKATNDCIAGDVLFHGSVGRTDLPGGNTETLMRSIREVLYTLPDETIVYPGHGPTTTIGREKKTNPYVRA
jgi:hydroxyacylglutathione hydrolase